MKKKTIIISAIVLAIIVCVSIFLYNTRKTIIMDIPGASGVIKTNARTVGRALKDAGVVYHENVSRSNTVWPTNKFRVKWRVIRPSSDEYAYELLLNGVPARLSDPIKDFDDISIRETRILVY